MRSFLLLETLRFVRELVGKDANFEKHEVSASRLLAGVGQPRYLA